MSTVVLVAFLAAHGLLHAAIWLPRPEPDPAHRPPFVPTHSAVLTVAAVPVPEVRSIARSLAVATMVAYLVSAAATAGSVSWTAPALTCAALLGLALKTLFFHPWLIVGVALDVLVLTAAVAGWPVSVP
jgi:hypothetical protein